MSDSRISELTALAASDVAGTDVIPIVDTSATTTKKVTAEGLRDHLVLAGLPIVSFSSVADGVVANGETYIIIDTSASPITWTIKARDSGGTLYTKAI